MVKILSENGLFGIDFLEKYGGSDTGILSFCIAVEEFSKKTDAAEGVLLFVQEQE